MILTCENCETRYLVPDSAIGKKGRIVKCTHCDYEWFQTLEGQKPVKSSSEDHGEDDDHLTDSESADDYESTVEEDIEIEPIPEAVKPLPQGSEVPAIRGEDEGIVAIRRARYAGYAAAALVFLGVMALLFVFRTTLVRVWPPVAGFYDLAGVLPPLPGEGLIIDRVTAETEISAQGVPVLNVSGYIVNLRPHPIEVPPLQAVIRTDTGEIFDSWHLDAPKDKIGPQEELAFTTSYPQIPGDIKDITMRFILASDRPAQMDAPQMDGGDSSDAGMADPEEHAAQSPRPPHGDNPGEEPPAAH